MAGGFNTFYLLQNPNPMTVAMRVLLQRGRAAVGQDLHRAGAQPPDAEPGRRDRPGAYSAVFQSQTPGNDISVERSMYLRAELRGEHRRARRCFHEHPVDLRRGLARRRAVRQFLPAVQPEPGRDRQSVLQARRRRPRRSAIVHQVLPLQRLTINARTSRSWPARTSAPSCARTEASSSNGRCPGDRWAPVVQPGSAATRRSARRGEQAVVPRRRRRGAGIRDVLPGRQPDPDPLVVEANFFTESAGPGGGPTTSRPSDARRSMNPESGTSAARPCSSRTTPFIAERRSTGAWAA